MRQSIIKGCLFILVVSGTKTAVAEPVEFIVDNGSNSTLNGLQISSNTRNWGSFGQVRIEPGRSGTFEWEPSASDSCGQFLRARFAQKGWSAPLRVDFCPEGAVRVSFE